MKSQCSDEDRVPLTFLLKPSSGQNIFPHACDQIHTDIPINLSFAKQQITKSLHAQGN